MGVWTEGKRFGFGRVGGVDRGVVGLAVGHGGELGQSGPLAVWNIVSNVWGGGTRYIKGVLIFMKFI